MDLNEPGASGSDDGGLRLEPPERPRWVKVSLLVVLALIVLFVLLQFVGGGEHGPGRHTGIGDPPPSVAADDAGDRSPADGGP